MNSAVGKMATPLPPKQYRIGEVADHSGLSRQTVHNYTVMGLIREQRWTPGGHRLYHETVFQALGRIEQLKSKKTLREIRSLLDRERVEGQPVTPAPNLSDPSSSPKP